MKFIVASATAPIFVEADEEPPVVEQGEAAQEECHRVQVGHVERAVLELCKKVRDHVGFQVPNRVGQNIQATPGPGNHHDGKEENRYLLVGRCLEDSRNADENV